LGDGFANKDELAYKDAGAGATSAA
jgi:hypothetical protein